MKYYPILTELEEIALMASQNSVDNTSDVVAYVREKRMTMRDDIRSKLWTEYRDASFNDFEIDGDVEQIVRDMFLPTRNGAQSQYVITIVGCTGSGKTRFLNGIINWIAENDPERFVMFKNYTDFIDTIRKEFFDGTYDNYGSNWDKAMNVDGAWGGLVVLDDIGAGKQTDFEAEKLYSIVNYRLGNNEPLVLSTNIPKDKWSEVFGERVSSRLKKTTIIEMPSVDFRELQGNLK